MGTSTYQKSRRRIDAYLYKCATPRIYIGQTQNTHTPVRNGARCQWNTFYISCRCNTDTVFIDYTIKFYNRNNSLVDTLQGTVYAADSTQYVYITNSVVNFPSNGKVSFTAVSHREGYIDSEIFSATIYSVLQTLVLNVNPPTGTEFTNFGYVTMDTGNITEDVVIRYNIATSNSSSQVPQMPSCPTSATSGLEYPGGQGILITSLSTAIAAKAFPSPLASTDYIESSEVDVRYSCIRADIPSPVLSPETGQFQGSVDVSISSTIPYIYYTLDGSTPTTSSIEYFGPIHLTNTTTVKAIAYEPLNNMTSQVTTEVYTIIPINLVTTKPASDIIPNGCKLNGTFYGDVDYVSSGRFQYKKSSLSGWSGDGISTIEGIVLNEVLTGEYEFSADAAPLESNTSYTFRAGVGSGDTLMYGSELTFQTPNPSGGGYGTYQFEEGSSTDDEHKTLFGSVNVSYIRIKKNGIDANTLDADDKVWWGSTGYQGRGILNKPWDYIGGKTNQQIEIRYKFSSSILYSTRPANNTTPGTNEGGAATEVARDLFCWGTSGNRKDPDSNSYYPWTTYFDPAMYNPYSSNITSLRVGKKTQDTKWWSDWAMAIGYKPTSGIYFNSEDSGPLYQSDQGTHVSLNYKSFPAYFKYEHYNSTYFSRTPSLIEYEYILYNRVTSSGYHFAKARINTSDGNYVNGLIILSDQFTNSMYQLNYPDSESAGYETNTISESSWYTYFNNFATFLPAAGWRYFDNSNNLVVLESGTSGVYWTSTRYNNNSAWTLKFTNSSLTFVDNLVNIGASVRLIGKLGQIR